MVLPARAEEEACDQRCAVTKEPTGTDIVPQPAERTDLTHWDGPTSAQGSGRSILFGTVAGFEGIVDRRAGRPRTVPLCRGWGTGKWVGVCGRRRVHRHRTLERSADNEESEKRHGDFCKELVRPHAVVIGTEFELRPSATLTCTPSEPTRKTISGRRDGRTGAAVGQLGVERWMQREREKGAPCKGWPAEVREVVSRVWRRQGGPGAPPISCF